MFFFMHPLVSWWSCVPNNTFVLFLLNHNNVMSSMLSYFVTLNIEVPVDLEPFIFHDSFWHMFVSFFTFIHLVLSTKFPSNQSSNVIMSLYFFSGLVSCTLSQYDLQSLYNLVPHSLHIGESFINVVFYIVCSQYLFLGCTNQCFRGNFQNTSH